MKCYSVEDIIINKWLNPGSILLLTYISMPIY